MKRKFAAIFCSLLLAISLFAGCSSSESASEEADSVSEEKTTEAVTEEETTEAVTLEETEESEEEDSEEEPVTIRVGSLKGPTSIGLMQLMEAAENGESEGNYEFTIAAAADELTASFAKEELDILLLPANTASILYHQTDGGVTVLDINTLSVLYVVATDTSIGGIEDLSGRTVYLPGKGTTPDYALQYLLDGYGVTDCTLEYKSEASEVVAILTEDPDAVGLIPQPYVTVACSEDPNLQIVIDLEEQWDTLQERQGTEAALVTGVTIVNSDFLAEHENACQTFIKEQETSVLYAQTEVAHTAELVVDAGIVGSTEVAEAAIPMCNICCITGDWMQEILSGYLEVLCGQNPEMTGGDVPADDFYYHD